MLEILQNLWGYAQTAFDFLLNTIKSLFLGLQMLHISISLPFGLVGFVPTILGVSISVTVTIFVIKFIIGR